MKRHDQQMVLSFENGCIYIFFELLELRMICLISCRTLHIDQFLLKTRDIKSLEKIFSMVEVRVCSTKNHGP